MLTDEQVEQFKEMFMTLTEEEKLQFMFKAGYDQAVEDLTGFEKTGIGVY